MNIVYVYFPIWTISNNFKNFFFFCLGTGKKIYLNYFDFSLTCYFICMRISRRWNTNVLSLQEYSFNHSPMSFFFCFLLNMRTKYYIDIELINVRNKKFSLTRMRMPFDWINTASENKIFVSFLHCKHLYLSNMPTWILLDHYKRINYQLMNKIVFTNMWSVLSVTCFRGLANRSVLLKLKNKINNIYLLKCKLFSTDKFFNAPIWIYWLRNLFLMIWTYSYQNETYWFHLVEDT